jgi:hypothetical protein
LACSKCRWKITISRVSSLKLELYCQEHINIAAWGTVGDEWMLYNVAPRRLPSVLRQFSNGGSQRACCVVLGGPRTNNAEYVDNDWVTAEKHRENINAKPEHPQCEAFASEFTHITYSIAMSLNQASHMYICEASLSGLLKHMPDS